MGYMTFYALVIGDEGQEISDGRREEILDWLEHDQNFHTELEDFHESGMSGYTKWYEHDQDMIRLSQAFPEVLFVLWGEGRSPETCGNATTSVAECRKLQPASSIRRSTPANLWIQKLRLTYSLHVARLRELTPKQ